ncbi:hypothetical protein NQ317_004992 [Molorchus minor]|uniref:Mitochondrial pyruvate carrier n=1 Tax=Molorchus minor TaxID=1323400 RepID=A0ABQ9K538_9CUCU|nr:hypothetical protein NQ317_004992 [Molorchus minor]
MSSVGKKLFNQLKSPEFRNYLMSTHFWGPIANWGIPLAALADINKDPKYISSKMTVACHFTNEGAQLVQLGRCIKYNYVDKKEEEQVVAVA